LINHKALSGQLPVSYQLFGLYCRLYFKLVPSSDYLRGGRYAFALAKNIHYLRAEAAYATIKVGKYKICLDLTDPRFLLVVNELRHPTDASILASYLKEGDTFVDVGANHGTFSIVASHLVGRTGQIVAVEPQVRLAKAIKASLAASPVSRYTVHQVALGDHDGEVELILPLSYSGMAGVYKDFSGAHGFRSRSVLLRRFDSLVEWQSFRGDVFIKVDVEGSEYAFLRGATEMILALHPTILIEINPNAMHASSTSAEDLRALLWSLGYRAYAELGRLTQPVPLEELTLSHRNILLRAEA
jgi:FkbM family methyltransferase